MVAEDRTQTKRLKINYSTTGGSSRHRDQVTNEDLLVLQTSKYNEANKKFSTQSSNQSSRKKMRTKGVISPTVLIPVDSPSSSSVKRRHSTLIAIHSGGQDLKESLISSDMYETQATNLGQVQIKLQPSKSDEELPANKKFVGV